jgi:hypothetical protein
MSTAVKQKIESICDDFGEKIEKNMHFALVFFEDSL